MIDVNELTKPIQLSPRRHRLLGVLLIVLGSFLLFMAISQVIGVVAFGAMMVAGKGPPNLNAAQLGGMFVASLLFGALGVAMFGGARRLRKGDHNLGMIVSPWAIQLVGGMLFFVILLMKAIAKGVPAKADFTMTGGLLMGAGMIWAGHRLRKAAKRPAPPPDEPKPPTS